MIRNLLIAAVVIMGLALLVHVLTLPMRPVLDAPTDHALPASTLPPAAPASPAPGVPNGK